MLAELVLTRWSRTTTGAAGFEFRSRGRNAVQEEGMEYGPVVDQRQQMWYSDLRADTTPRGPRPLSRRLVPLRNVCIAAVTLNNQIVATILG